ncbi:uncharacterized protein LOC144129565 [Amblyomma americanum]
MSARAIVQETKIMPYSEELKPDRGDLSTIHPGIVIYIGRYSRNHDLLFPKSFDAFHNFTIWVAVHPESYDLPYELSLIHPSKSYASVRVQGGRCYGSVASEHGTLVDHLGRSPCTYPGSAFTCGLITRYARTGEGYKSGYAAECFVENRVIKTGEFRGLNDLRLWEHLHHGTYISDMMFGPKNRKDYPANMDVTPFIKAFVRLEVGDSATFYGNCTELKETSLLNTTSNKTLPPPSELGARWVEIKRMTSGCVYIYETKSKAVDSYDYLSLFLHSESLVLDAGAFVPLFSKNYIIYTVLVCM